MVHAGQRFQRLPLLEWLIVYLRKRWKGCSRSNWKNREGRVARFRCPFLSRCKGGHGGRMNHKFWWKKEADWRPLWPTGGSSLACPFLLSHTGQFVRGSRFEDSSRSAGKVAFQSLANASDPIYRWVLAISLGYSRRFSVQCDYATLFGDTNYVLFRVVLCLFATLLSIWKSSCGERKINDHRCCSDRKILVEGTRKSRSVDRDDSRLVEGVVILGGGELDGGLTRIVGGNDVNDWYRGDIIHVAGTKRTSMRFIAGDGKNS